MNWIHLVFVFLLGASLFIYSMASPATIVVFGNLAKIFSLLLASLSLTSTQNAYSPGDTPQKAWTSLAAGMWIWFFAQVIFAYYKLIAQTNPYPSLADLFFVLAYIPLFIGMIFLIKDFKSTGLPMGSKQSYMVQGLVLLVIYAVIFFTLLLDLVNRPDPAALKFLNVGYPTFDFMLIAMASVLVRITWMMRGGSIARSWIMLCLGFAAIGVADISFAYNSSLAVLDVVFFSAYFLIGLSGVYQLRMLRQ